MAPVGYLQLGKAGLTENFMQTLKTRFDKHRTIKVSVLKSAGREKKQVKEYSEKMLNELGEKFTSKIIGFTIILKRWRKPVR
ncbi:MAG: YhbY family RNA-binding protein [Nanoarchaeota archaeon]|nr:YhbY family RNA-binding protein [Nanoarchaeota archaeon]